MISSEVRMQASDRSAEIVRSVGTKLREIRERHDLTQKDLSARLQSAGMVSGSSAKTVSSWERAETPLPITALPVLAEAFRLETSALTRQLGLCGDLGGREFVITEATELFSQLADEPPEVSDTILRWLRDAIGFVRTTRVPRAGAHDLRPRE